LLSQKLFQLPIKKHVFLFIGSGQKAETDEEHVEYNRLFDIVRQVASDYRWQVIFSFVNSSNPQAQRVVEFFAITQTPQLFYVDLSSDGKKYKLAGEITAESAKKFVKEANDGTAKVFAKSEDPHEYSGKGVRTLVGSDHDAIAHDPKLTVFVEYYAPWCGHCKQLAPVWEELATEYDSQENVVIAKVDGTKNDVAGVAIKGFPTLYIYPAGENKKPELYSGGRDLSSLKAFLKGHVAGEDSADEPSEDL